MRIRATKRIGPIVITQPIGNPRRWRTDHKALRITVIVIVGAVLLLVCGSFLASVL